jgi:membrane-associated protein
MNYARFLAFSVGGAIFWVVSLVGAGYFLGNMPVVKNNLTVVIFGIIALSLTPIALEYLRARARRA